MTGEYVWTERDQVDDDQICMECNSINSPDRTECRDCGATMLTAGEAGFDDIVEEPVDDDPIADNISTEEPDPDIVVEQKKHNVVDALYGELKAIKVGFWKFNESLSITAVWIGSLYCVYEITTFLETTSTLQLAVGAVLATFVIMWGCGIDETDGWVFTAD